MSLLGSSKSPVGLLAVSALMSAATASAREMGIAPPILTASLGAFVGVAGSVLSGLANRRLIRKGEKQEQLKDALHNEHLAQAAAQALKFTLLKQKLGNDDLDTERLAEAAEKHWLELQAGQKESVAVYSEPELQVRLIEYLSDDGTSKGLGPDQWLAVLQGARAISPFELTIDPGRMRLLAERLSQNYPKELYGAFKSDLASGGAAFGGMVLRLLCGIATQNQSNGSNKVDGKDAKALRKQMAQLMTALERDARPISTQLDERTREVLNEVATVRRLIVRRASILLGTGCVLAALIVGLLLTTLYQIMPRYEARVSAELWRVPAGSREAMSALPGEPFHTGDSLRITVEPQGDSFLYAFWRSESGKVFPLYPGNFGSLSSGLNPVRRGSRVGIPGDEKPLKLTDPAGETYEIFVLSSPQPQPEIEQIFTNGLLPKDSPLLSTLLAAANRNGSKGRKGEPVFSAAAPVATNSALQYAIAHGKVQIQKFEIAHH